MNQSLQRTSRRWRSVMFLAVSAVAPVTIAMGASTPQPRPQRAGTPTYGISGVFADAAGSGAHGLNERIRVQSLLDARQFLHELVKSYNRY